MQREILCPCGERGLKCPKLWCLAPTCSVAAPSIEIWFFLQLCPLNSQIFALSAISKDNFSDIKGRIVFYCREFQPRFQTQDLTPWTMRFVPVLIIPFRNCYTHTFAHLKTWRKNSSGWKFFFFLMYLSNSVAGADFRVLVLGWHRLLWNSRSIMSAKKMWSYFILNKSSFEDGKSELSANTIMNPDFRVHFETIVSEIFPYIFMGVVGLEIQLQGLF